MESLSLAYDTTDSPQFESRWMGWLEMPFACANERVAAEFSETLVSI